MPVVEDEIGDSWIHGVATDPFKVAALRTLCKLKTEWLKENKLKKDSQEYQKFADNLLCVSEHTWGMDSKMHFCDTENYSKKAFQIARSKDIVQPKNIFGDFPFRLTAFFTNIFGDKHYSYSHIETSWIEQKQYIKKAIESLPLALKTQAENEISKLIPTKIANIDNNSPYILGDIITFNDWTLSIGKYGGINLKHKNKDILNGIERPIIDYRSYGVSDFDYYAKHYLRHKQAWAVADNLNPGLKGRVTITHKVLLLMKLQIQA